MDHIFTFEHGDFANDRVIEHHGTNAMTNTIDKTHKEVFAKEDE
jgi:hypothetical protein